MPSPRGYLLTVWLLTAAGCVQDPTLACGDLRCPTNTRCISGQCARPDQVTACDGLADGTMCSSVSVIRGSCQGGVCHEAICGDQIVDFPERCDDGNTTGGDGCSATCDSEEICGNGVVDYLLGEQCDDAGIGAALSGDGCTSRCTVEVAAWQSAPVPNPSRYGQAMAYDVQRARTVMFGGSTSTATLGDTWEWDGQNWVRQQPLLSPERRTRAAMAYDRVGGHVVMFGGQGNGGALDDTWEWDGLTWQLLTPAMSPPARFQHAMAWDDASHRVLLFGGTDGSTKLGDTWAWDGTTWTLATTPAPTARARMAMATDLGRHEIVLFGGDVGNGQADTWIWDGTSWSAPTVSGPPPSARWNAVMASSSAGVLLFGGASIVASTLTYDADTWRWDGAALHWTQLANGTPDLESEGGMVFDEARTRVVLAQSLSVLPDLQTWEWNGASWARSPNNQTPPGRGISAMVTETARGRAFMFGGANGILSAGDDTWEYDGVWTQRTVTPRPPIRYDHAMAYDAARDQVVLFGGSRFCLCAGVAYPDTWLWDGASWSNPIPSRSPLGRWRHFMAYDAERREVVLFGGINATYVPFEETWTWDGTTWTNRMVPSPPQTTSRAMAYDAHRQRVVLVEATSTWEWDGTSWTQYTPPTQPPDRLEPTLVYNPLRQRVTLIAGQPSAGDAFETWEWDGTTWSLIATLTTAPPRTGSEAAYDPTTRRIVMFGGYDSFNELGDTWTYGFTSTVPEDRCAVGTDLDGDGRTACADPDCWGRCTPFCPPGTTCDPAAPHCGDGSCSSIEDDHVCPGDCP